MKVFWRHWEKCQKGFFEGFRKILISQDLPSNANNKIITPITRYFLGHRELAQNLQKSLFGNFPNAARKPSKNLPAPSKNVENLSTKTVRGVFFEGF